MRSSESCCLILATPCSRQHRSCSLQNRSVNFWHRSCARQNRAVNFRHRSCPLQNRSCALQNRAVTFPQLLAPVRIARAPFRIALSTSGTALFHSMETFFYVFIPLLLLFAAQQSLPSSLLASVACGRLSTQSASHKFCGRVAQACAKSKSLWLVCVVPFLLLLFVPVPLFSGRQAKKSKE